MTTRSAEDAELSDLAPGPVRHKTDFLGNIAEPGPIQHTNTADIDTPMETLDDRMFEAQSATFGTRKKPTTVTPDTQEAKKLALNAMSYAKLVTVNPLDVHAWDAASVFENINPVQKSLWEGVQGTKVLAYKAYSARLSDAEEVLQLRDGIKVALAMTENPVISPPTPADNTTRGDTPPYCMLISGIPAEKLKTLLAKVSPTRNQGNGEN